MNGFSRRVILPLWLMMPLACGAADGDVVAKAGAVEVKVSDLKQLLDARGVDASAIGQIKAETLDKLARAEALRKLVAAEAQAKGWDKRPEVRYQMDRAAEQAMVADYVEHVSIPAADYPSVKELQEAYAANKEQFRVPKQLHLQQIFLKLPAGASRDQQEAVSREAEGVARKAREKNADFAALARKYSEHKDSAEQGGDMGWLALDEIVPEIRQAASSLAKGETSKPLKSSGGWHILRLADSREAALRSFDEVKAFLVQALRKRQAAENERKYLDGLAARNPVNVNQASLEQLRAK